MSYAVSIAANIDKSPYFDATVADGVAAFSVYNHMYAPANFGDPEAEYNRLMQGVAMWDVACERQVELAGPDAGILARYLTPRNLSLWRLDRENTYLYAPMMACSLTILFS